MTGDVALQRSPVVKERETVTDLRTEVNMMAIEAVRETYSAAVTTVSSSENITILKMTAVRSQWSPPPPPPPPPAPAVPGGRWW